MDRSAEAIRGYMDYLRDLGIYDVYRRSEPDGDKERDAEFQQLLRSFAPASQVSQESSRQSNEVNCSTPAAPLSQNISGTNAMHAAVAKVPAKPLRTPAGPNIVITPPVTARVPETEPPLAPLDEDLPPETGPFAPPPMPLISFSQLAPLPSSRTASAEKPAALQRLRDTIGDCTRCPLAYAGRHSIVFADGNPDAQLMFIGEGPGADEDTSGLPFVGKAGQLLNNMIAAMGLRREQVYIANIVKCRPPKNRVPEPVEASTCSQFLLQQIDIVRPEVIVALGSTAATYLLGVRQSLNGLRGRWHDVRGAKCAVTYHPAFLLRDPRQKGEAWKDLQRVMTELNLKPPQRGN